MGLRLLLLVHNVGQISPQLMFKSSFLKNNYIIQEILFNNYVTLEQKISRHNILIEVCLLNGKLACEKPDSFYWTSQSGHGENHLANIIIYNMQCQKSCLKTYM